MIQTIMCDPATGLGTVLTTYTGLAEPPLRAGEVACTPAQAENPGAWKLVGGALVAASAADLVKPLPLLAAQLVAAASAACAAITAQIVPDKVHETAYANAATIVWANGGTPPASDPAKTVFADQAASVGITDPATFAKVVVAVSLGSMQLSTILATLEGAAKTARTPADLAAALTAFEASLSTFVGSLNAAGLTITVAAPAAISIAGLDA